MPPRQRVSAPRGAPNSFHFFPRLPPELRLKIWNYTITTSFVPVCWSQNQRVFLSTRTPPAILHTCQESRLFGLKRYTLTFASSPEFARIYFSFEDDVVFFDWRTLGPLPGRLGRKLGDDECTKIQSMLINEAILLEHCDENLRELERFTGLKHLAVICDIDEPETGGCYGYEEMTMFAKDLDRDRELEQDHSPDQTWPQLLCLRDVEIPAGDSKCSRHWWFDGWNSRAMVKQREKWPVVMANCLTLTCGDDEDDEDYGDYEDYHASFLFNILFNTTDSDDDE